MHENRRTRIVLGVLLLVAVALITISYRDGGTSSGSGAGNSAFGPVERLAGDIANPVAGFFRAATGHDSSEIANLQAQNDQLRAELSHAQLARADEAQLTQLLQLSDRGGYRVVTASVIAAGGAYSDTVTIDVGTRDGVQPNETVLNGDGLVGTVTSAGPETATVLLATDAAATAGVRMAGTSTIGEVTGTGQTLAARDELRLTLFSAADRIHTGEPLVTFGSVGGRPYVPGVPVGEVTAVTSQPGSLTQTGLVRPFADFTGLGVVGVVIAPPRTDPRDSVLRGIVSAPSPAPSRAAGGKAGASRGPSAPRPSAPGPSAPRPSASAGG